MQVGTGTVGGRSGWGRRHQPSLLGTSVSRNGFPEEPGREREHSNQRKGALAYTVFQMRETTSAKVQGLGRERLRSISSKLNRGSSELV